MKTIKFMMDRVFAALTWFGFVLLVLMTILIFSNVFCRYLLNFSIAWADEVSLIFLIWFVFIALAIGVRTRKMASIDFITPFFPNARRLDLVTAKIVDFLTFCFGIVLVNFGWDLIQIGSYSTLASFDLPSYLEYIFIPVSGVLVMYSALVQFFESRSALPEAEYLDTLFLKKGEPNV